MGSINEYKDVEHLKDAEHIKDVENLKDVERLRAQHDEVEPNLKKILHRNGIWGLEANSM